MSPRWSLLRLTNGWIDGNLDMETWSSRVADSMDQTNGAYLMFPELIVQKPLFPNRVAVGRSEKFGIRGWVVSSF